MMRVLQMLSVICLAGAAASTVARGEAAISEPVGSGDGLRIVVPDDGSASSMTVETARPSTIPEPLYLAVFGAGILVLLRRRG